jgi:hypothetical protein
MRQPAWLCGGCAAAVRRLCGGCAAAVRLGLSTVATVSQASPLVDVSLKEQLMSGRFIALTMCVSKP